MSAEELLRQGRLSDAFAALKEQVRKEPANAKLRVFLFQMFAVLGDWERALTQLNAAAEMDASTLAMAQMYREALNCEALRADARVGDFRVIASHQESLHSHDAISLLTEGETFAAESLDPRLFQTLIHAG